eukprot:CAMPEP_0206395838 /NCGR_PEP_ID=MMETSP0294-20121207/22388_1 /ASSEMBLY_ACC=CAM_ASM_000327 /TAXON_ID=39354 /ORGANISM="Heterosigma akashiwo, Strain CCMP2393" /LENGTH=41 /DNA_ID= /DNA_START= /DNA_END= /DNA_ORIENTATION=
MISYKGGQAGDEDAVEKDEEENVERLLAGLPKWPKRALERA